MASIEMGTGHLAVKPSFRGFRRAVTGEARGAGAEGVRGFSKVFERGSKSAGVSAGRGFARGFKSSATVDAALKSVNREVQQAASKIGAARDAERNAAGRVRVAEAQLAEARAKYAADSSQVVRAEERLATAQRSHGSASEKLTEATDRLKNAQAALADVQSKAAVSGSALFKQLSKDVEPLTAKINGVTARMGAFYRTSKLMGPMRTAVDGLSKAWTVTGGVISGLGPVVFKPMLKGLGEVASKSTSWVKKTVTEMPVVGRAVSAVGNTLSTAGSWFGTLGRAGAAAASTVAKALGPVGSQVASSLGAGFRAAASSAASAAAAIGNSFKNVLGGTVTAAVAGLVMSLKGGFDRLASVETATAKMRGFGLASETVTSVMGQVKDAVAGTVYTVGEMGNAAAAAVLAGVEPGEKLNGYMALLKNTATAAGAPLNEIQSIFGKIVANVGGPVTTELNQLTDRGIPAWTILAEKMGLSVTEVKKLASEGQITSDVIVEHLGGAMERMAEEVGGTTESALLRMRSSFARFGEALMAQSFPAVKSVADAVRTVMDLAIELVGPITEAFGFDGFASGIEKIDAFTVKVRSFVDLLKSGSTEGDSAIAGIVDKVKELAPALGLAALAVLPMMGSFLAGLPVIGPMLAGLGPSLIGGLGPLLAGGGLIAMLAISPEAFSSAISSIVPAVVGGLSSMLASAADLIQQLVPMLVSNLVANAPLLVAGIVQLVGGLGDAIISVLPVVVAAALQLVVGLVQAIVSGLPELINGGIQMVLGLVEGLLNALPVLIAAIVTAIPLLVTGIVSAIPLIVEGGLQLFLGLVQALVTALPQILTALIAAVPVLVTSLVSMLPVFVEGALQLFLGIVMGLIQALPQIITAIITAIPQLISAIASALPQIITAAVQVFLGLVTGLVQAIPQVISALIGMAPQLVGAVIQMVPQLIRAGVDLVRGLAQGIANSAGMVMDAIGAMIGDAVSWAKGLLGIKSPSRVFMQFGDYTGEGLAIGIERTVGRVRSAATGLVDAAKSAFDQLSAHELDPPVIRGLEIPAADIAMAQAGLVGAGRRVASTAPVQVTAPVEVKMMERDPKRVGRAIGRGVVETLGLI